MGSILVIHARKVFLEEFSAPKLVLPSALEVYEPEHSVITIQKHHNIRIFFLLVEWIDRPGQYVYLKH